MPRVTTKELHHIAKRARKIGEVLSGASWTLKPTEDSYQYVDDIVQKINHYQLKDEQISLTDQQRTAMGNYLLAVRREKNDYDLGRIRDQHLNLLDKILLKMAYSKVVRDHRDHLFEQLTPSPL